MSAKVCEKCGGATLRVEFRDSFAPSDDPRKYGQWIVCASCGHEWPAKSRSILDEPGGGGAK